MRLLSIILSTVSVVAALGLVLALCLPADCLSDSQRRKIFLACIGAAALLGAVRFALGIWLQHWRGYWGGPFTGRSSQDDPDKMSLGRVSHTGSAILLAGVALAAFFSLSGGPTLKPSRIGFVPGIFLACIFTGFFLVMVGWTLDSRAHEAARRGPELPGEPRMTVEDLLRRWLPVVVGTLFLLAVALALIFLR